MTTSNVEGQPQPQGAVPTISGTGYPTAKPLSEDLPATGVEEDDDLMYVDINECKEFPDGPDVEDSDEEMGDDDADDTEDADVEDMAITVLPNDGAVLASAICPTDPNIVCTGNQADHAVLFRLTDAGTHSKVEMKGHTDSIVSVAFSADGVYVATGSYDSTVRVWKTEDASLVHSLTGPSNEVDWVRWHPKGHALLAGAADCTAWMWWAPTGKVMQVFAGHADRVNCGCFANDGKVIATGAQSGELIIWNPRQGTATFNLQLHQDAILCLEAHPKEPVVVTGSMDGTCVVVNVESGKKFATLSGHDHEVEGVAFFQGDLNLLATGGIDGTVRVWDSNKWELRVSVPAHKELDGGVTRLAWHPLLPIVLSSGTDCMIRAHDARSGAQVRVLSGHTKEIFDLSSILYNGDVRLVSAGEDSTARVFKL